MGMITEEKNNEFYINNPTCPHCKKTMEGFFFKFYKDPNFGDTESFASFFWTDVWFQCKYCPFNQHLKEHEIDTMNSYPLDQINFPKGFDKKNVKLTRMTTK